MHIGTLLWNPLQPLNLSQPGQKKIKILSQIEIEVRKAVYENFKNSNACTQINFINHMVEAFLGVIDRFISKL
jgi:hypothetical protein